MFQVCCKRSPPEGLAELRSEPAAICYMSQQLLLHLLSAVGHGAGLVFSVGRMFALKV